MRLPRKLAAVATALVGAVALSSCSIYDVPLPGGADVGSHPIKVHIMFRDVLDLVPQSTVKVDDVTVGKVTKISLKGYVADVTVELPNTVDLPDNARAEIRQTSLLGEKFVSLSKPADPEGQLGNGDVIGLEDTGRNPELEEVFGALALLLNGGGVAQLKTISEELNTAFSGREDAVRSIITQVRGFMTQLANNKTSIVTALENVNRLSLELRRQDGTLKSALKDLPPAIASVNSQRADLVKMLQSLSKLSSVGVRVIQASKASTIDALKNLAPVLAALGKADDALPKSLQVLLTYPFIDEAVGRDPVVARNLHMGDFTNLSINLTLDLFNLPNIPGLAPGVSLADLLSKCEKSPAGALCTQLKGLLSGSQLKQLCGLVPALCKNSNNNGGGGLPIPGIGGVLGGTSNKADTSSNPQAGGNVLGQLLGGLLGHGRAAPGSAYDASGAQDPFLLSGSGYDPGMGTLLLQGVAYQ
ncbi:MCE family protein [Nocardioides marmorisolisilvae]|uniref:MCE family protein n=1 Tax=Nocardioides marmorisolisilvae TaxID=1542737 RepID=A0A3N0DZN3_9ACTN|nr:MCE family protein [Nocardioides marmorisolisilvae]RNL81052.1 MCE family protein [Nocardioides marmorisolisilvae]